VPPVTAALRRWGAEPVMLDPSEFPGRAALSLQYADGEFGADWAGMALHGIPALRGVTALWQNVLVCSPLPAVAPEVRETCVAASERVLIGLLDSLQVFQLDPYWSKARADNKPYQLQVAQALGLDVPATIISNDARAVREFARRRGRVITKMLVQPRRTEPGEDGAPIVFTTAMTDDDLAELDGLDLCPMIFQERVENQRDVRATIVGRRIFCAAIEGAGRSGGDLDWRRHAFARDEAPQWLPYELPRAISDRLLRLLDHFGLNYGAVDLIVRPDGRHVFLELNASGSFVFLGEPHVAAIADAIAEVLVDPGARRVAGGR